MPELGRDQKQATKNEAAEQKTVTYTAPRKPMSFAEAKAMSHRRFAYAYEELAK